MENNTLKNKITYSVTGYEGLEDKILSLRNRNRASKRTKQYLDWRYLGQKSPIPPLIFWVLFDNNPIGMAGLVFRPYWINGEKRYIGVLDDISLDNEYRGKGIARDFFVYVNSLLNEISVPFSIVIPNIPAQKTLSSAGWKIQEKLVRHVFFLNVYDKVNSILKMRALSKIISYIYNSLITLIINWNTVEKYKMEFLDSLDDSFDTFWNNIKKRGVIFNDRSVSTLSWRYLAHPLYKFTTVKITDGSKFIAYIIYHIREDQKECIIYDIIACKDFHISPVIWTFIKHLQRNSNVHVLNVVLNQKNKISNKLRKKGFSARKADNIFQTYTALTRDIMPAINWYVTIGDKEV